MAVGEGDVGGIGLGPDGMVERDDLLNFLHCKPDWSILKIHSFQLHISWSDGYFSASLPALAEASFGPTLAEAINGACEMICHLFTAPAEMASQLTIATELDESATRQIRMT
ncbi:hypothetical protein HRW12_35385 [Streptomyces lunaelactis]|uniref:hypothetical protein n=1 Tax=Streptomyces lunaelactis TaxID=1535768 RepID=UPI00158589FA|nr:hypothetical protein [Streptomyces lunaelactis]NUK38919.1 hypothetical protein [Streptomyces lunaelactis]NUK46023.1 hypothetical protein [Streptomyces lunaelactis]